jgi:tRNA(His) guanylyltransferase
MELSDRMKFYERMGVGDTALVHTLPTFARLDGKCFHTFTRGLNRPYDEALSSLMVSTMSYLVQETDARIGYTQSDEITLMWHSESFDSQIFFNARLQKMVSVLAAMTTLYFNKNLPQFLPHKSNQNPLFDCRVWNVPNKEEAVNVFVWREQDAVRNSISMAAQSVYSHKELMNKSSDQMQEMLFQKGINWNNYPDFFKRGTYARVRQELRKFTAQELDKLPPKHEARSNPDLMVERRVIDTGPLPILTQIKNRVEVVFGEVKY